MEVPMRGSRRVSGAGQSTKEGVDAARKRLVAKAGQVRLAWRFILVTVLICLASIVWLSQTSKIVSLGYDIERMEKQKAVLNRQAEQLQSQVAQYENLKRVEEEARTKLGMIPAKNVVYLKIPANLLPINHETNPNNALAPVNDWWRELTEMLPRPFRGSSPAEPVRQEETKR